VPHGPKESQNTKHLDWRNEIELLLEANINVYAVQALGRGHATKFYEEVARKTGGFHLNLNQFSDVTDMILGVCYKQVGESHLETFHAEVQKAGRMNRSLDAAFNKMMGKAPTKSAYGDASLHSVPEGRFQVLKVDEDCRIDEFVKDQGLLFRTGRGFYELTKPVLVQGTKEVVLRHKKTGDFFSGDKAREMLGLPSLADDIDTKIKPVALDDYYAFIQSTSNNRKLIGKTKFLYEVSDWS
jgi:hypothetical protein